MTGAESGEDTSQDRKIDFVSIIIFLFLFSFAIVSALYLYEGIML